MPENNNPSYDIKFLLENAKKNGIITSPYQNRRSLAIPTEDVSQYDTGFKTPQDGDMFEALQEHRAANQSGIDQIANGVAKGIGLAGTTFADTFGGTVFGIANSIVNGSKQGYMNAFVNNPFSNSMQDVNEGMEKLFTNYRTKAEQNAGLLDQMFDGDKAANFWGDMFIKNMGFAGGAMAAGMVSGKLFSALGRTFAQKKEVELFNKMTKSLAAGEAKNLDEAIKILQQAPELVETSAAEIKSLLEQGARTARNWNRVNQIASSTLAATGEARIEALGNGRQFYESNKQVLDSEYIDPATGQVKTGLEEEYTNKLKSLDENVKGFQNAEFLWNTVLLTASNYTGYRDMFAKNYALNAKRFSDNIKINPLGKIANNEAATFIKPKWYNTLGKAGASANREGAEEFFQGVVQKGTEDYYTGKFKGSKDSSISDMIESVGKGLSESLNQEGLTNYVLGALTGLVMPGAGIYNAYKETNLENKEAQERVANINKAYSEYVAELKQDPTRTIINFQEMINRSSNLDKAQQQALLNGDKYNYEALKHEKFFNLANAYIKAGKTEELTEMLQDETKLSVDDIRNKYATPIDPKDASKGKKSLFDENWTDTEVKTYIRKQASTNLAAIEDLKSVTEDLEAMFGEQIALVSDGDKTKQVAIKDILNRSLYLGKTLDKRIIDLHNEITKDVLKYTNDSYTLAELSQTSPTFIKDLTVKDLETLQNSIDNLGKLEIAEPIKKDLQAKLKDYTQLLGERKAHNSAFIRLTNNNFTELLSTLGKLDSKATTQGEAEEAKKDTVNTEITKQKEAEIEKLDTTSSTFEEELFDIEEKFNTQAPIVNISDEESQVNTIGSEPKLITKEKSNAELESNALSDYPFYTTNRTVEYDRTTRNKDNRFETSYNEQGYPILNSNQDAIRWNSFLEDNNAQITPKNFILQAFKLSSSNIPTYIKDNASSTIKEGFKKDGKVAKQEDYDNAIVVTLVDIKTGEVVKQDGKEIFTFLPLTSSLYSNNNLSKVNLKALLQYYKNNNKIVIKDSENLFSEDLASLITVGDKQYTPNQFRELLINFAKGKHVESIQEIKNSLETNSNTYIPIVGVSNGILLTRKAGKDSEGKRISPMSPVSEVLNNKRGIDTKTKVGINDVEVVVVTSNKRFNIGSTSIVNARKGSTIIYNKNTKEYFYANTRNLNNDDIELVLHLLDKVKENPNKKLSEITVNVGNSNKFYYNTEKGKIFEVPIFAKNGQMSLMNNILFWGGNKDAVTKHTVYLENGRIYFANPNGNFNITSIGLNEIRDTSLNGDFMKFLKNKRFNPNKAMFKTDALYNHPVVVNGELTWKVYPNGYKDFLLNSEDPILITNAVNSNSKNNTGKTLFASKNVILDSSNNGKPKLVNELKVSKQEVITQPKEGLPNEELDFGTTPTIKITDFDNATVAQVEDQIEKCETAGEGSSRKKPKTKGRIKNV